MGREDIICEYYRGYDEDGRLARDNAHHLEYLTTREYLDRYLHAGDRILEIGAGTGIYSLHYARVGCEVTAVDLIEENLAVMREKARGVAGIDIRHGDACDLSGLADATFDATLVLGPLYHLFDDAEIDAAVSEAVRVTRPGGIVAFAYLPNDGTIANLGGSLGRVLDDPDRYLLDGFRLARIPEEVFSTFCVDEFDGLVRRHGLDVLHTVATDGVAHLIAGKLNALGPERFSAWVRYHLATCERPDLIGHSQHALVVCRKP